MLYKKRNLISLLAALAVIVIAAASLISCGTGEKIQLKIFNAGSLIVPFQVMEEEFEAQNPRIDVLLEGHGSIQVIRGVTELDQEVDVAAVADSQLIPLLMYQTQIPDNKGPYADWNIEFATNKLGIAFTDGSLYSEEITATNWHEIIARPDVKTGLADPRIDSLGYRALMAIQLAGNYYKDDTLFKRLIIDNFLAGFEVDKAGDVTTIKIPQLVKPSQKRIFLRSYSIQLLALLESGDIDYAFEYESVTRQCGLKFLELPSAVNLGSSDYISQYQQVNVELDFQRFASVSPKFQGKQIIYGVTIPRNAPHPREAESFIKFLLGPKGQSILADNYQPALIPACADNMSNVPEALKPLLQ